MAKNLILQPGYQFKVVVTDPAAPNSGDAVRYGNMTGVALLDEGDGGVAATETVVDFGPAIWDLPVTAESGAIAVGDALYYDDAIDGLNNDSAEYFFGFALEAVASGTDTINVIHCPSPGAGTLGSGTVGSANLAAHAVLTANLAVGVLSADAAGRALVAAGWLNVATALNAFGTDSIANAWLIQAITDGSFQADTATRALFADAIWTEAKLQPGAANAGLSGLVAKFVANANVIGGLPVVHVIDIADSAGNTDVTFTHKTKILLAGFKNTGVAAHATTDTIQLQNVTDAITAVTPKTAVVNAVILFSTLIEAYDTIAAGTKLRVVAAKGGGALNVACTVFVIGIRVA